jgi:hypothetical protein
MCGDGRRIGLQEVFAQEATGNECSFRKAEATGNGCFFLEGRGDRQWMFLSEAGDSAFAFADILVGRCVLNLICVCGFSMIMLEGFVTYCYIIGSVLRVVGCDVNIM